jgi:ABC-type dipeptide/oligopeptide/nickel transport system permease subunit
MRPRTVFLSALFVAAMVIAAAQPALVVVSQQATSTTTTSSAGPHPTKTDVSTLIVGGSSVTLQATVTDLNPTPSNPKGVVNWSDGGAGGNFTESGSCTLFPDLATSDASLCHINYATGTSSSSSLVIDFTATYQGDPSHATSSGKLTLTLASGGSTTTATSGGTTTTSASSGALTTTTSGGATTAVTSTGGATVNISTVSGAILPGITETVSAVTVVLFIAGSYLFFTKVSLTRMVLRRSTARVGLALIAFVLLLMIYGLFLDPYPVRAFPCLGTCSGLPPFVDLAHPFGTYPTGQDVFSEIAHGAPIDLGIALVATAVAVAIGTTVGLLAGYGRWFVRDTFLMLIQVVLLLPSFAIVVWVYRTYGNTDLFLSPLLTNYLAILLGLFAWPPIALVVRDAAKTLQQSEFVTAARGLGAGTRRVIVKHMLPNITTSILSIASIVFAANITAEALFTYLGLVDYTSDTVTWGFLLGEGNRYLFGAWWIAFFPGVMIIITVLGFSLLGDAISEALNPKVGIGI